MTYLSIIRGIAGPTFCRWRCFVAAVYSYYKTFCTNWLLFDSKGSQIGPQGNNLSIETFYNRDRPKITRDRSYVERSYIYSGGCRISEHNNPRYGPRHIVGVSCVIRR